MSQTGEGKLNPAGTMYLRSERIFKNLVLHYPDITIDWVLQNGARGPDPNQVLYFQSNGHLPPPGDANFQGSLYARPADRDEAIQVYNNQGKGITQRVSTKIDNIIKNDATLTAGARTYRTLLERFYSENSRMPNTDELNQLKSSDPSRAAAIESSKQARQQPKNLAITSIDSRTVKSTAPVAGRASRLMSMIERNKQAGAKFD